MGRYYEGKPKPLYVGDMKKRRKRKRPTNNGRRTRNNMQNYNYDQEENWVSDERYREL